MISLGWGAHTLRLNIVPGAVFVGAIELRTPTGVPTPWPAGLTAWLRVSKGSGFEAIWPATVTGAVMSWDVDASLTAVVPSNAYAELWLDPADADPVLWLEGPVQACAQPGGFGQIVAVPAPVAGQGAVGVPLPGPPGPAGPAGPAGPPGPPGGSGLEHVQSTPAATWTIAHGFGRLPWSVLVLDASGTVVLADTENPDLNTTVLTFAAPMAGRALLL